MSAQPLKSEPTPPLAQTTSLQLFSLRGQHALLTGATRGIGAACAMALAQAGASCCLVVRPGKSAQENKSYLEALPTDQGQQHCLLITDLGDMAEVKTAFDKALQLPEMGGRIDILVNCGGIQRRHDSTEFPEDDWDEVINVNLKSVFLLCQAAGRHMVPRRSGKIVNFCSLLSFQGGLRVPAYAASKAAVSNITKSLSNEWSQHNVQVNGIAPGYIATDMNEKLLSDATRLRQITERIPAGRWGLPDDFAGPLLFLCSKASQYVCGETLVVDGGWMGR